MKKLTKQTVAKYTAAIEAAQATFQAEIELLAAQAREEILPYFREHRLAFTTGNGTWLISKPSADNAPYFRYEDFLDDDALPENIRDLLCLETEYNQCLGYFIDDIKRDEYGTETSVSPTQLSTEHLDALRVFAVSNGRTWKSKLNNAWQNGKYNVDDPNVECALQQVRNTFGPTWLTKFSFHDAKTHYAGR